MPSKASPKEKRDVAGSGKNKSVLLGTHDKLKHIGHFVMWDRKRQIVWIAAGLILGTFISYSDSLDEQGNFVPRFFVFMETLVLIIMGVLFYLYSRKKQ